MARWQHSDEEVRRYLDDPDSRRPSGPRGKLAAYWKNREFRLAVIVLGSLVGLTLLTALTIGLWMFSMRDELPPLTEIENPEFQLATIAYTADGEELARYASQNRAWIRYGDMSPHLIAALVATEDKRFYDHWGMDLFRTASAVIQTVLGKFGLPFDTQGGSTLTQQLARNLYNTRIGRKQTVSRKLKEMITAVQLEQRYTKQEIIEMYLNTVEFGYNVYGIETASRTFFRKSASDLDVSEAAILVGLLKGTTIYNPYRHPERAQRRRNTVLLLMRDQGLIEPAAYDTLRVLPVEAYNSSYAITSSIAPYFAQHVKEWLERWGRENGYDVLEDGLVVHTTLDSRMQEAATLAMRGQMECLQAVVDFQWSRPQGTVYSQESCDYLNIETDYTPFEYYWDAHPDYLDQMIRETARFRTARARGADGSNLMRQLRNDRVFLDSLKAVKTRLETGFVAMDPNSGHVKAWIGGRDLAIDWFDHVDKAARQPGSTFKPFLYTAAIDNGWSPYYTLLDDSLNYQVPGTDQVWNPTNDGSVSGQVMTLREGLANSKNTISARLILEVGAPQVAFIARVMGITSPLEEVPALALGTSDVTLYEMTTAYSTLANGGFRIDPIVVTRIEDRQGNILFEAEQTPRQALSPETAHTMVDMLRAVIQRGTGIRLRTQFGMGDYDLAGKTGTTQNSADGWFMAMHQDLVAGAWVGFNDRRVSFRTTWWGQGAHNALLVVGDFMRRLRSAEGGPLLDPSNRFPPPPILYQEARDPLELDGRRRDGRIGW